MPEFVPIAGEFVARCADIDLARPLYEEHRREIVAAMDRFGVCVFTNEAPVSDEHHLAFGREFGPLLRQRMQQTVSGRGIRLSTDELIDVGNQTKTVTFMLRTIPDVRFIRVIFCGIPM